MSTQPTTCNSNIDKKYDYHYSNKNYTIRIMSTFKPLDHRQVAEKVEQALGAYGTKQSRMCVCSLPNKSLRVKIAAIGGNRVINRDEVMQQFKTMNLHEVYDNVDCVDEATEDVEIVWDEIGLSMEEAEEIISDVQKGFADVRTCLKHVDNNFWEFWDNVVNKQDVDKDLVIDLKRVKVRLEQIRIKLMINKDLVEKNIWEMSS